MITALVITRIAAALGFGIAVLFYLVNLYAFPKKLHQMPTAWAMGATLFLIFLATILPLKELSSENYWRSLFAWIAFAAAAILTVPFTFIQKEFGNSEISAIMYTIRENSFQALAKVTLSDFRRPLLQHITILSILVASVAALTRLFPQFDLLLIALSLVVILSSPMARHLRNLHCRISVDDDVWIDEHYSSPEITTRPVTRKNLIVIYLESLERTYRHIPSTAEAFSPLGEIEDRGFSARNVLQVYGTHMTVGGIIASQAGVPFISNGVRSAEKFGATESKGADELFMPGVISLGKLLSREGYSLSYLNGSDASMFAIDRFLGTHGYSHIKGMATDPRWRDVAGRNIWGVPDSVLFDAAQDEVDRLQALREPFSLSILTTATHGPDGFADPEFTWGGNNAVNGMVRAIAGTAHNVTCFLNHLERRGLLETSIIAVMSDHLAMPNSLREELDQFQDQRRNLFVLLGLDQAKIVDTPATTFDIFPTLIEALGFRLKGGRANFGVSLISGNRTLAELVVKNELDNILSSNTSIRRKLWHG